MILSPLIQELVDALRTLPGVGPKSAQRMAFFVLTQAQEKGHYLGHVLQKAIRQVRTCQCCRMLCETDICSICKHVQRDKSIVCVVESPANVIAIENAGMYQGLYFVLSGHLSPIDGIGPEEIGIEQFIQRIEDEDVREVVLALSATVEGEATAYYLVELIKKRGLKATRIAHGIPLGGELEYVDEGTLAKALLDRTNI
ncbi:MAG: recombination mediator RecR [Candidatus Berkiella sp.]